MQRQLAFTDYYQANRQAIDRLEDGDLRGSDGQSLSRGERQQVVEFLQRLNHRCPRPQDPVCVWRLEIHKLRIVDGRKTVTARTIQRWATLAIACGLVWRDVEVLALGGSQYNAWTVDWRAIRSGPAGSPPGAMSGAELVPSGATPEAERTRSGAMPDYPPARGTTRRDTTRHRVASGCDIVSGPTPADPIPADPIPLSSPRAARQRAVCPAGWEGVRDGLIRRGIGIANTLCQQAAEQGATAAAVAAMLDRLGSAAPASAAMALVRSCGAEEAHAHAQRERRTTATALVREAKVRGIPRERLVTALEQRGLSLSDSDESLTGL